MGSITLPAWFLAKNPRARVLLVSHEARFAAHLGRQARGLFREYAPSLFSEEIDPTSRARDWWHTSQGGCMWTSSLGGSITGKRVEGAILDDIVKGQETAASKTARESTWQWWHSDFQTRVNPEGWIVLILTRWHEDDIAGRLLGAEPDLWDVISLPALAKANDQLGRAEGEALWPSRWPREHLETIRGTVPPSVWEALYQQSPTPDGGEIFQREWFREYEHRENKFVLHCGDGATRTYDVEHCANTFITVDLAVSESQTADFFVAAVWHVTPERDLLLAHLERRRVRGPDQPPILERLYKEFLPSYIAIESVAYQLSLVQEMSSRGLPVAAYKVSRSKEARAQGAAAYFYQGKVFTRRGAPWAEDYRTELALFPRGPHDDMVDATSMAADRLAGLDFPRIY